MNKIFFLLMFIAIQTNASVTSIDEKVNGSCSNKEQLHMESILKLKQLSYENGLTPKINLLAAKLNLLDTKICAGSIEIDQYCNLASEILTNVKKLRSLQFEHGMIEKHVLQSATTNSENLLSYCTNK